MFHTHPETARRGSATLADLWLDIEADKMPASNVPFPQADDLEKVLSLIRIADSKPAAKRQDFVEAFGFTPRQADYYANAAIFIGALIRYAPGTYKTTAVGRAIAKATNDRVTARLVARQILAAPGFREAAGKRIGATLRSNRHPLRANALNDVTSARRSKTIDAWLDRIEEDL